MGSTSRTWADVAKSLESTPTAGPIRPSERGVKASLCRGKLLVVLGHYGWILSHDAIDDRKADKHAGRIYLSMRDVRQGSMVKAGDEVEFYLYTDESGLGAEDCYALANSLLQSKRGPNVNTGVREFPPLGASSTIRKKRGKAPVQAEVEPVTSTKADSAMPQSHGFTMRPNAYEFVPVIKGGSGLAMNPTAKEFVPVVPRRHPALNLAARAFTPALETKSLPRTLLNAAFFDDDSSDDGEESADEKEEDSPPPPGLEGVPSNDDESWRMRNAAAAAKVCAEVGGDIRWDVVLEMMAEMKPEASAVKTLAFAAVNKPLRASSPSGSTSSGESGSESSTCSTDDTPRAVRPPPGLLAPPGLMAQSGFEQQKFLAGCR